MRSLTEKQKVDVAIANRSSHHSSGRPSVDLGNAIDNL